MKSIFVTSHGRTASKFLAQIVSKSREWKVLHEPHPLSLEGLRGRGRTDRTIEISPVMLDLAIHSTATTRAVMLRNPADSLLSALNRVACPIERRRIAICFGCQLVVVDQLIEHYGFQAIRFADLVRSPERCQVELRKLGITDVCVESADMVRVNPSPRRLPQLPNRVQSLIDRHQWYVRKYGL